MGILGIHSTFKRMYAYFVPLPYFRNPPESNSRFDTHLFYKQLHFKQLRLIFGNKIKQLLNNLRQADFGQKFK